MSMLTLPQIAEHITTHLKRMEANPTINTAPGMRPESTMRIFVRPWAYHSGSKLALIYRAWDVHSPAYLTKSEAQKYLEWLDAGNSGRHYEALKTA